MIFVHGLRGKSKMILIDKRELQEVVEADLQPKKPGPRKNGVDTGKICALYKAGWKLKDIAEEIPCAQETARRTLIQAGLWKGKNNG